MKNSYKYVTCCFILFTLLFYCTKIHAQDKPKGQEWNVPEKEALKKSEIKFDSDAIKEGKDLWSQNCKSCHGTKGLGDGSKAANIEISCGDFSSGETQDLSDGALFWKMTAGRKPMPAFNSKLTDTERWQLVAFIRTLKKAGNTTQVSNKTSKELTTQEKENKTVKKDTATIISTLNKPTSDALSKTDSSKKYSPEYMELKIEIEMLKEEMKAINKKVDSINEGRKQK